MGAWTSKHWEKRLSKAIWLVNTTGYAYQAVHGLSELCTEERDKVSVAHTKNQLG